MTMEAFGEQSFPEEPSGTETEPGWLGENELAETRARVPILYVEALPIRVEPDGQISEVGLLLRGSPTTGSITRTLVSGRVLHGERIRDALMRHLENDLGSTAFPVLPASTVPAAVAEYFPWPGDTFHDPRQHAVSLAYLIPVTGECEPRQDALEISWMSPAEAASDMVAVEMEGGRGTLVRRLLFSAAALD